MEQSPARFFVYGTLKAGQANFPLVAPFVRAIAPATARGQLFDLGLFPAMADAAGLVRGEVLAIDPADLPRVLALLDPLEGYEPTDPTGSIYLRRVITATLDDGQQVTAYAYFYNRDYRTLRPVPDGEWQGPSAEQPLDEPDELTTFREHVRGYRARQRED